MSLLDQSNNYSNYSSLNIGIPPKLHCIAMDKARVKALWGGRAGAKSESVGRMLIAKMLLHTNYNKCNILCTREIDCSLEDSVYATLVEIIDIYNLEPYFRIIKNRLYCMNRQHFDDRVTGVFMFKGFKSSTDKSASLKSMKGLDVIWVEEAQTISESSLDIIMPTIRKGNSEVWFTFNRFKRDDPVWEFIHSRDDALIVNIGWEDNQYITDTLRQEAIQMRKNNPEKYKHVWGGEPAVLVDNPLWAYEIIQQARPSNNKWLSSIFRVEDYSSIVVGVDPAISVDKTSDLTGIVVVGKLKEPRLDINNNLTTDNYVVIEDLTAKLAPEEWARETARAVVRFQAECVVAEKNQGGEMVRAMLDQAKVNAHVELVHASKGKTTRAEPIAAMYGRKEVVHLKEFYPLTEQMAMFSTRGYMGEDSPDRVDALVWGVWWLAELGDHDFVELY